MRSGLNLRVGLCWGQFRSTVAGDCTGKAGETQGHCTPMWQHTFFSFNHTWAVFNSEMLHSPKRNQGKNPLCFLKTSAKVLMRESLSYRKYEIPRKQTHNYQEPETYYGLWLLTPIKLDVLTPRMQFPNGLACALILYLPSKHGPSLLEGMKAKMES